MRHATPSLVLAAITALAGPSDAGQVVTFSTDITGATTKVDVDSTSSWDFQLLGGAPTVTEVQGVFVMKSQGSPTAGITFTLYDRFDGYEDPSAVVLRSVTLTPAAFTNQFSPVAFDLTGLNLVSSPVNPTNFSVALTSPTASNEAYFIKGDSFSSNSPTSVNTGSPVTPAFSNPEPSSIAMVASAVPLGLGYWLRRRRRRAAA